MPEFHPVEHYIRHLVDRPKMEQHFIIRHRAPQEFLWKSEDLPVNIMHVHMSVIS